MTPLWFPIVLSALAIVGGAFFNNYIKRPKLTHTGGGGGGGPALGYSNNITIANAPGFLGIRVGETVIFGKRILPPIPAALLIERNVAKECRAWIYDASENRAMTILWWQVKSAPMVQFVTLDSGESASLFLFARTEAEPLHYFLFQPANNTDNMPKIPAPEVGWRDKQTFRIRISDAYDRTLLSVPIMMRPDHDGRLRCEIRGVGGGF